jgi:hypothetical protein
MKLKLLPLLLTLSNSGGCASGGDRPTHESHKQMSPTSTPVSEVSTTPLPVHRILSDESHERLGKRTVDVFLAGPVEKSELERLARAIQAKDTTTHDRTYISYWISPQDPRKDNAWGVTNFVVVETDDGDLRSELSTTIMGLTPSKAAEITKTSQNEVANRKVLGTWLVQAMAGRFVVFQERGKYYMDRRFSDGSGGVNELRGKKTPRGLKLTEVGGIPSEYYLIDKRGWLIGGNEYGEFFATAPE